ncbi:DUF4114 domain-containing protein [Oscillatoria salina]|uniref:DUF4114 domain-containing protein n=1 Tax=Oscillatoria salina TaxID=331517 RepID=UPI001CCD490F|nr:DUF4114 domain-containing protein [Oscillatoria salina]MBZ8179341.1 DUF4114 domain-containing protein [Oscillatoria salina IIICB1]
MQFIPITVEAGEILSFDWNFLTNESIPGTVYNDLGLVSISSDLAKLADTNSNLFRSSNSFGLETNYGTFSYEFTTAGTFTVGIAVVDTGNQAVDSALLIDNLRLESAQVFGFETGDFTDWQVIGDASIHTAEFGLNPTEGTFQALITTNDNAVSGEEIASFLGLNSAQISSLGNGNVAEASALQLMPITVKAGDVLSFDWNFLTNESTPSSSFNDFGFVSISNSLFELVDTNSSFDSFNSQFRSQTGYGSFSYEFTQGGTYTIGIGVADAEDPAVNSALLIDNLKIVSNTSKVKLSNQSETVLSNDANELISPRANSHSSVTKLSTSESSPLTDVTSVTTSNQSETGLGNGVNEPISDFVNSQSSLTQSSTTNSPELIDLTSSTNQSVPVTIPVVESDAAFENFAGLYAVENSRGTVIDPLTGQRFDPGEAGYIGAAIRQSQLPGKGVSFNRDGIDAATIFLESSLYAPFLIADGTPEKLLDANSANDPAVYFAFANANPDRQNHLRALGNNTFGFEDMFGGGDFDFNDLTFSADYAIA